MRRAPRCVVLCLILLSSTVRVGSAQGPIRLASEAEPASVATVEGGMSVFALLEGLGEAFDLDIVFDPRMRDQLLELALRDVGPEEAFDRVAAAGGLMWVALDERSVLFAEDNPQMRRRYERQVVQTFYLEHANLRDVMTVLRSTMGARSLATDERLQAVTIRDTVSRVALAEQLLRRHDRAPAILEVDVRLVRLSAAELAGSGLAGPGVTLPPRLGAEDALALVSAGELVAQPTLSLADGQEAGIRIGRQGADSTTFELNLSARYARSNRAVKLEARVEGDSAGGEHRVQLSTQRLEPGETWALSGLLRADPEAGTDEPDHLVVLLTPRVASPGTVQAADRAPLAVGTEEHLGLERTER